MKTPTLTPFKRTSLISVRCSVYTQNKMIRLEKKSSKLCAPSFLFLVPLPPVPRSEQQRRRQCRTVTVFLETFETFCKRSLSDIPRWLFFICCILLEEGTLRSPGASLINYNKQANSLCVTEECRFFSTFILLLYILKAGRLLTGGYSVNDKICFASAALNNVI